MRSRDRKLALASDLQILALTMGSAIIVFGSWLATFSIGRLIQRIAARAGANKGVIQGIRDLMLIIWIAISISGVATYTGIASEFTALTISGIAGLTISLALQTTISNIISGIFLLSDGSVRVDDEIEYSGVRGIVVKIALRNTWIQTKEGKIAVVGNSNLSGGPLINYSATERLIKKAITV
jgi:small conductance mechanosensitive channel